MNRIRNYFRDEEGATAVEYGIMVALIAAIIVLVVLVLGQRVKSGFCDTEASLETGGATSQVTETDDC